MNFLDITFYITKNEDKKTRMKMLRDYKRENFTQIIRSLINFFINNDIQIKDDELNKIKNDNNKVRKTASNIPEKDLLEFKIKLLNEKVEKRNDLLKILLNKWLDGEIEITREEFLNIN